MSDSEVEQDWVHSGFHPYDANRYDPEKENEPCLVCGTELEGHYYVRSGGSESCPECDVVVRQLD